MTSTIDEKAFAAVLRDDGGEQQTLPNSYRGQALRRILKAYESSKQPEPASGEGMDIKKATGESTAGIAPNGQIVVSGSFQYAPKHQPPANAQQVTADREALGRFAVKVRAFVARVEAREYGYKTTGEEIISLLDQIISRGETILGDESYRKDETGKAVLDEGQVPSPATKQGEE